MSSPVFGVGIGITKKDFVESTGKYVVEPGSAYLTVLSMTGLVGATGIVVFMVGLAKNFFACQHRIPAPDRLEAMAVGSFWAVHGIAEGWTFAVGSSICLFFWIWTGRVSDLAGIGAGISRQSHRTDL